ncbi:MAG: hypothetical protein M1370_07685 [Bacteroidetes bacterium]|nr:hypothetical protein [Bacteroidota bacterium]MCL5026261.1 hypothetical protein [Chloroflexota bacterium]
MQTHPLAATLFLICWLAVWVTTLATWLFDAAGRPIGMHPVAIYLNLLLPFAVGALVGWWRQGPPTGARRIGPSIGAGLQAGLLLIEINLLGELLLWMLLYRLVLGRPLAESGGWLEGAVELAEFAIMSAIVGLLLGATGGLAGGLLAAVLRRARGQGPRAGRAGSP